MNEQLKPEKVVFGIGFIVSLLIFSVPIYYIVQHSYTLPAIYHDFYALKWSYAEAVLFTFGLFSVAYSIKHLVK